MPAQQRIPASDHDNTLELRLFDLAHTKTTDLLTRQPDLIMLPHSYCK